MEKSCCFEMVLVVVYCGENMKDKNKYYCSSIINSDMNAIQYKYIHRNKLHPQSCCMHIFKYLDVYSGNRGNIFIRIIKTCFHKPSSLVCTKKNNPVTRLFTDDNCVSFKYLRA